LAVVDHQSSQYAAFNSSKAKLTESDWAQVKDTLSKILNTTIPTDRALMICYFARGKKCWERGKRQRNIFSGKSRFIKNMREYTSRNNAIVFFVYTKDCEYPYIELDKDDFVLDSGFIENTLFLEHENCQGYIVVKPNGTFYKHYGAEERSGVGAFLRTE
jgi:hypothetical protein